MWRRMTKKIMNRCRFNWKLSKIVLAYLAKNRNEDLKVIDLDLVAIFPTHFSCFPFVILLLWLLRHLIGVFSCVNCTIIGVSSKSRSSNLRELTFIRVPNVLLRLIIWGAAALREVISIRIVADLFVLRFSKDNFIFFLGNIIWI